MVTTGFFFSCWATWISPASANLFNAGYLAFRLTLNSFGIAVVSVTILDRRRPVSNQIARATAKCAFPCSREASESHFKGIGPLENAL